MNIRYPIYEGVYRILTVVCAARNQTILPDPLCSYEIEEVVRTGKCEFFDNGVGDKEPDDNARKEGKKRGFF